MPSSSYYIGQLTPMMTNWLLVKMKASFTITHLLIACYDWILQALDISLSICNFIGVMISMGSIHLHPIFCSSKYRGFMSLNSKVVSSTVHHLLSYARWRGSIRESSAYLLDGYIGLFRSCNPVPIWCGGTLRVHCSYSKSKSRSNPHSAIQLRSSVMQ